jgi:hypothetical protein
MSKGLSWPLAVKLDNRATAHTANRGILFISIFIPHPGVEGHNLW